MHRHARRRASGRDHSPTAHFDKGTRPDSYLPLSPAHTSVQAFARASTHVSARASARVSGLASTHARLIAPHGKPAEAVPQRAPREPTLLRANTIFEPTLARLLAPHGQPAEVVPQRAPLEPQPVPAYRDAHVHGWPARTGNADVRAARRRTPELSCSHPCTCPCTCPCACPCVRVDAGALLLVQLPLQLDLLLVQRGDLAHM